MLTNKRKAQIMDCLIDHYCEGWRVRDCIGFLQNVADLTDQELVELGFDVNDL